MEKQFISGGEYFQLLEMTRYADDNKTTVESIIDAFEYLKDKKTEEHSYHSTKTIENPHLDFLRIALERTYFSSNYNQGTEEFLKSDYLSRELKNEIYNALNGNCSEQLMELLSSEKQIKEFSKEELKAIIDSLHKTSDCSFDNEQKKKCSDIYDLFVDYIFVIDGVGPTEFVKEKYEKILPIIILEKSGIPSHPSYYSGYGVDKRYLSENHLFSIYIKFVRYYPDKAEEFVKMVRSISRLTATEFVTNYLSFKRNGLNSDFKHEESNISVDGLYDETRNLIGAVSMFTLFSNQSNLDKRYELDTHFSIKSNFAQMVEEFKNVQELKQSQIKENGEVKILNKKMKQD